MLSFKLSFLALVQGDLGIVQIITISNSAVMFTCLKNSKNVGMSRFFAVFYSKLSMLRTLDEHLLLYAPHLQSKETKDIELNE